MSNAAEKAASNRVSGGNRCYAHLLRDCKGKLSHEHTVSKAVLKEISSGEGVVVSGAAWIRPGTSRRLLPEALTSRVLCERHNSWLSKYDTAGGAAIQAIRNAIRSARDGGAGSFKGSVDPELFAGWCLKVLCGQAASGQLATATGERVEVVVRPEWVEVLFGRRPWPPLWKMMLVADGSLSVVAEGGGLTVGYLHSKRSEDGGAVEVVIQGIRVILFLAEAPMTFEGAKLVDFPVRVTLIPAKGNECRTVEFARGSAVREVAFRLSET